MEKELNINVTADGGELVIRHGQAPEIFVYDGFKYDAYSTPSLIELVKARGHVSDTVIAYSDVGVKVILNSYTQSRDQDRLNYSYKTSMQHDEWINILKGGCSFGQKNLIDFLRRREDGEVEQIESLISQLQNFKFVTTINGDFTYDDRNNYTFAIKMGETEGTVRLPQIIMANIEIFNESGFTQMMEIEVEVVKPRSEQEKLSFNLTCPKYARYKKRALENEINNIKKELEGYLIVTGNI